MGWRIGIVPNNLVEKIRGLGEFDGDEESSLNIRKSFHVHFSILDNFERYDPLKCRQGGM